MADPPPYAAGRVGRAEALCVLALCSLFAAQALWGMAQQGATFDETAHLPAGYSYLTTNDHRLNPEHPPLAKLIAALPLTALRGVRFSAAWPEWQAGEQFLLGARFLYVENSPTQLLFWGRVPIVLLTILLGVIIWRWARDLAGHTAGLSALGMFALTPEFLAHGSLVTTDAPVSAFMFASFYAVFRATRRSSVGAILVCGVAWGAALASKFSALIFSPLLPLAFLARAATSEPLVLTLPRRSQRLLTDRAQRARALGLAAVISTLLAWGTLWLAYGFDAASFTSVARVAGLTPELAQTFERVHALGVLPGAYVQGLASATASASTRLSFLLGHVSVHGFIYYFVITPLVKMPLPVLLLLIWGVAHGISCWRRGRQAYALLLVPAALYYVVSLQGRLNIGHRHLLPMYPFLFVLAGSAATLLWKRALTAALGLTLTTWLLVGTLTVGPNYLTYFNELGGGARGGMSIVVDSNLDWGQGLPALKRWMDEAGVKRVYLSYFGSAWPEAYGIDYVALPSFFPLQRPAANHIDLEQAQYIAVSATNLQRVYLEANAPQELLHFLEHLRTTREPEAVVGNSIYVYRLRKRAGESAAAK